MANNIEITVKINAKDTLTATLRKPLFNEYRYATMELQKQPGFLDQISCGSSLVQHCWVEGDQKLKTGDVSQDPEIATAYVSLCMDAYNELYKAFDSEIKKK